MEENPKDVPPTRLRELMFGIKENDLRTSKRLTGTVPESPLYEVEQDNEYRDPTCMYKDTLFGS